MIDPSPPPPSRVELKKVCLFLFFDKSFKEEEAFGPRQAKKALVSRGAF
jgi:hypothetical protein